jgi:hypothetical protein
MKKGLSKSTLGSEKPVRRKRKYDEEFKQQALAMVRNGQKSELHLIIGRLEDFTSRVKDGLDQADWNNRRDIIRALVKRVEVEKGRVNVVFRVDQLPFESSPARGSLQHCRRRKDVKEGRGVARRLLGLTYLLLPVSFRSASRVFP